MAGARLCTLVSGAPCTTACRTPSLPLLFRVAAGRREGSGAREQLVPMCRGNLLGVAPATAVFMAVYEPAKKAIAAETGSQQQSFLVAAALAGWAASLVRVPTEVVKQRLQAGEFKSPAKAVRASLMHRHACALLTAPKLFLELLCPAELMCTSG